MQKYLLAIERKEKITMELNNIFLIENGSCKRLKSYIYEAEEVTQNELFKEENKIFSRYAELNKAHFPIIKKNQVAKYMRENKSFLIKATYKAYDKEQKTFCDSWSNDYDIYLSKEDIKSIEEKERTFNQEQGKTAFEKYYIIELLKPLFYTKGSDLKLYKELSDIPEYSRHRAEQLKNKKQSMYDFWKARKPEKAEKLKKAYEEAIAQGYNFLCFVPSEKKESCIFTASCGFVRYETTKEYDQAEKLAKALNSFLYKDNTITTRQMLSILEHYNITKKRAK